MFVFTFPDWSRRIGLDEITFSASSEPALVGIARVIDADTIELQGLRVRPCRHASRKKGARRSVGALGINHLWPLQPAHIGALTGS